MFISACLVIRLAKLKAGRCLQFMRACSVMRTCKSECSSVNGCLYGNERVKVWYRACCCHWYIRVSVWIDRQNRSLLNLFSQLFRRC
jgi:hypothetical protein